MYNWFQKHWSKYENLEQKLWSYMCPWKKNPLQYIGINLTKCVSQGLVVHMFLEFLQLQNVLWSKATSGPYCFYNFCKHIFTSTNKPVDFWDIALCTRRFWGSKYYWHLQILRPIALFYRTDCTPRYKFLMHALSLKLSIKLSRIFNYCI